MSIKQVKNFIYESLVILYIWGTIITFVGQPCTVPSGSMRQKLRVGDVVWVNKLYYRGPKVPRTLSIPFADKTIWGTKIPSYLHIPFMPYLRLWAFGFFKMKRGDVFVFHAPHEVDYPVDVRTRYVKRLRGLSGDTIEVVNGVLYVNGEAEREEETKNVMYRYLVTTRQQVYGRFFSSYGIAKQDVKVAAGGHYVYATREMAHKLRENPVVVGVVKSPLPEKEHRYNCEQVMIPYRGMEVVMDKEGCKKYGETIVKYEGHRGAEVHDGTLYIEGEKVEKYLFRQDYYFAVGDNYWRSYDGFSWQKDSLAFVPEDHIEGKAVFVIFGARDGLEGGDSLVRRVWLFSLLKGDFEWGRSLKKV